MKLIPIIIYCLIVSACGGGSGKSDFAVSGTGDVKYRITLNASWSSTTHPDDFPSGAHFSDLVGATHNINMVYWEEGGVATAGIEQMAETGGTSNLVNEINTNITLADRKFVILGDGIGTSPGSRSFTLPVNATHPHLTLVTMIAPSPDWFIGVNGYNLMPGGNWIDNDTVTLYAYDAGTDSGTNYTSANSDSDPQQLITQIMDTPFLVDTTVVPVGELLIERIE
jgi:hypothetical protein